MYKQLDRKEVGIRIKQARKTKKLSQFELAELAGVDEKQIYRIESGISSPKLEVFLKIAEILELQIDCFNVIDVDKKAYMKEIFEILHDANDEKRKLYYILLKSLAENL